MEGSKTSQIQPGESHFPRGPQKVQNLTFGHGSKSGTPSAHPNPTTKRGSKMGGEFTNRPFTTNPWTVGIPSLGLDVSPCSLWKKIRLHPGFDHSPQNSSRRLVSSPRASAASRSRRALSLSCRASRASCRCDFSSLGWSVA